MTEEEQRAIVDKIIADLIESEKQDSIQQAEQARELARGDDGPRSVNTMNMLGGGGAQKGEWYFYNPQLIKQGQQEWRRRWGNRPLEDNWRRKNKQVVMSEGMTEEELAQTDSLTTDSTRQTMPKLETDAHKPEYYLQQIPRTEQDFIASDSLWREAMVALYYIYRDRLEDAELTEQTLRALEARFVTHPSVAAIQDEEQVIQWAFEHITEPLLEETETRVQDDNNRRREYLETAFEQVILDLSLQINELQGKALL